MGDEKEQRMSLTPEALEQLRRAAYEVRDRAGSLEYSLNLAAFVGERAHLLVDELMAMKAARAPGPDVAKLLAAAREADLWFSGQREGAHMVQATLRAAIAEYEAARRIG